MGVLFGESMRGTAGYAPLVVRVLVGLIMIAHGWQKLTQVGPANFGDQMLGPLGVPLPEVMAFLVTFVELVGGILLIVGPLSRLAALLLTIDLVVAVLLVKTNVGFLSGSNGTGAELDLALIGGVLSSFACGSWEAVGGPIARVRGRLGGGRLNPNEEEEVEFESKPWQQFRPKGVEATASFLAVSNSHKLGPLALRDRGAGCLYPRTA